MRDRSVSDRNDNTAEVSTAPVQKCGTKVKARATLAEHVEGGAKLPFGSPNAEQGKGALPEQPKWVRLVADTIDHVTNGEKRYAKKKQAMQEA